MEFQMKTDDQEKARWPIVVKQGGRWRHYYAIGRNKYL